MAVRKLMLVAVPAILLAGCAQYAPQYGQPVEQQAADRLECKAIAQGITPHSQGGGFYAQGSPQFVRNAGIAYAGASLIGAFAEAAAQAENFDECMIAHGYRKVRS